MNKENFKSGFAAIVGRPNVGKSTLINQLIGQKIAIMSDKPQTTRNQIRSILNTAGAQIVFLDTPGIHKPKHKLGEFMVDTAINALNEVDIVIFVVEADEKVGPGDKFVIENLKAVKTPVFLLINKIDLLPSKESLFKIIEVYQKEMSFAEIIPISAIEKDSLDNLVPQIEKYLPKGPQYYPSDMVTDQPERLVIAELIREKVLHLTREEIPHAIAVDVEEVTARKNGMVFIKATIYTERDSQKGIIVGKQGMMLRKVGALARTDIENLLGSKIFLDLWVKVKKDWRNKDSMLKSFGFTEE